MKRAPRLALLLAAALGFGLLLAASVRAEPLGGGDAEGMGDKRSIGSDVSLKHGAHNFSFECTAASGGANTKLDCDDPFPNNEPNLVVDPTNPLHLIGSSNDYGSCCDQWYTTFNGGATWSTGNMSIEDPQRTGSDPVTSFDRKHGVALHASLNYRFKPDGEACDGDVVVSPSSDGGLTWDKPALVDDGFGCDLSKTQVFDDKEWITTDNDPSSPFYGRTYVTWSSFVAHGGAYASSAIFESHSDDGGHHWTPGMEISGANAALCTFQEDGPAGVCDEDQFSVVTVAPNGTVYVAFENSQNQGLWEPGEVNDDQYLLVRSTNGGATWSAPSFVVGLEDGTRDYPINVDDRQTLTDYQVRVNSAGNIVASPRNGNLYLVFGDNRNGAHDTASPVTNIDTFVMSSTNGGFTWSSPSRVDAGAGDQWFPWVDVNPANGNIGVLYHDRGASNGPTYATALAEGSPGSLVKTTVSTPASNPTLSEFFQAGAPGCELCATFHGDYISVAYGSDGHANTAWTDMRDPSPFTAGLFLQFIYFARK
jgi:hypothetical protein